MYEDGESVLYGPIDPEAVSICLEDLGMIMVNTLIMACKANPQILEALIITTEYEQSKA